MQKQKIVLTAFFSVASIMAVSSLTMLGMARRDIEGKQGEISRLKGEIATLSDKIQKMENRRAKVWKPHAAPDVPEKKAEEPKTISVVNVAYDSDRCLNVVLSQRLDMDAVRRYVEVSPMQKGALSFSYGTYYDCDQKRHLPKLTIRGEYAFRTNVTLRLRRGMPVLDDHTGERALAEDYVYSFKRQDLWSETGFAVPGRYLPPEGRRTIAVESVNIKKLHTEICRVEPRNTVQLLAREEGKYSHGNVDADSAYTKELSGEVEERDFPCACVPNERERIMLPVKMNDGKSEKGVFLVTVRNGDKPHNEYGRYWGRREDYNPNVCRLVCISDLGVSVRKCGKDTGVWVTSLTSGRPVSGAWVDVYSAANVKIAEGRTSADGWCAAKRIDKGEAFAVVVYSSDAADMTFVALGDSNLVDETYVEGSRDEYLAPNECTAFAWSDRGIYRHGEKILFHTIIRNGRMTAPAKMPLTLALLDPNGKKFAEKTMTTDDCGGIAYDGFSVPADRPSGEWSVTVSIPGKDGKLLGTLNVKVEEFAPPQIRVKVDVAEGVHPSNLTFRVSGEHLFGGVADSLACEGAVVFEDVPFSPVGWRGYTFGNEMRGLKPNFRPLKAAVLDRDGKHVYEAPIWADTGLPKAAVRVTAQGTVFEDGGRPANARGSTVCHYYPYYLGSDMKNWMRNDNVKVRFACVDSAGKAHRGVKKLMAAIDRVDSVYSYVDDGAGNTRMRCERVTSHVLDKAELATAEDGTLVYELPVKECGDYVFTLTDPETEVSFGKAFYLGDGEGCEMRASPGNPSKVSLTLDKAFYRVGERPHMLVKAPFAGFALVSVLREGNVYTQVHNLTNATSEIQLPATEHSWAPNVDVMVSVVQSVGAGSGYLAARAHGQATVKVRPIENELQPTMTAKVEIKEKSGSKVLVDIAASNAEYAVVTLVDEGINLLSGDCTPDPIAAFADVRSAEHPLFDIFNRLLPIDDGNLKAGGVKTGGGFGAEMLSRVSPVPTKRFKPLARWKSAVKMENGKGQAVFELPEFSGEVRITALAYSTNATGVATILRKVSPKVVVLPDAPRFAAPGDAFRVCMPVYNRSGKKGAVVYEVNGERGEVQLADNESTNLLFMVKAPSEPGTMPIHFQVRGFGEMHEETIDLPIRPAVAWRETAGTERLAANAKMRLVAAGDSARFSVAVTASPIGELAAALEWLADYPHGCLEQTTSRIFPLITAGGIFNSVASGVETNRMKYVAAGVRRVESMIRWNDFTMWPDCDYAPWDNEVSQYAAHFLFEAEKAGVKMEEYSKKRLFAFLGKWAMSDDNRVSAYACHTLAIAGKPEKDRMFRLYDVRDSLDALSRARLAMAFILINDRVRAADLLRQSFEPQSVKEAAFLLLALLELNPDDVRVVPLVKHLTDRRSRERYHWGTTCDNAHALLAIGAYYLHHPVKGGDPLVAYSYADGGKEVSSMLGKRERRRFCAKSAELVNRSSADAFVQWRKMELPEISSVTNEATGIFICRRYLTPDGEVANLEDLRLGKLLMAELSITSAVTRVVNDLVVEDLFPAAFEPVHNDLSNSSLRSSASWIMRKDMRDDRMLVFSRRFELKKNNEVKVYYPLRVVSAGDFVLPGVSVEAMYDPALRACRAPGRIVVRH